MLWKLPKNKGQLRNATDLVNVNYLDRPQMSLTRIIVANRPETTARAAGAGVAAGHSGATGATRSPFWGIDAELIA